MTTLFYSSKKNDDTILFVQRDSEKVVNIKLIICILEQLFGVKSKFHKWELYCFANVKDKQQQYKQTFVCDSGSLPFTYLEVHIHYRDNVIPDGIQFKSVLKESLDVGKEIYSRMEIDLFLSIMF